MRIDLHTHSTASDGTDAPAALVSAAAAAGLDVVGITDHDTAGGWSAAAAEAQRVGVALVPGIEVSALSNGVTVHVLAYLPDPESPALVAAMAATRESRTSRARRMADLLAADFPLTWDDVLAQTKPGTTIGRPHLADALVSAGVVSDRSVAFASILAPYGPYYVPHAAPTAEAAVLAIVAAGGVPVFAHPGADGRGRVVTDDVIAELATVGLRGLEVFHRDHDARQRDRLLGLAGELGLVVTGSSDYHGKGKPNELGENTTAPHVLAQIEEWGTGAVIR